MIYLWSHEFGSTAERTRRRTIPHLLFTQPIIRDLDVSIQGKQDIVKL